MKKHPRDRFITVYGRKPVLEILENENLTVDKLLLVKKAKGDIIRQILELCQQRGIEPERLSAEQVSKISKNPKQDQGIAVDVLAPQMQSSESYFADPPPIAQLMALDGVTTPGNVGLLIRSCTAMGVGIVLPRKGSAKLTPLVVKASAGLVFKGTLVKCERLTPALKQAKAAGFTIYGLAGGTKHGLYQTELADRAVFVLGNESEGVSPQVELLVDQWLSIPMMEGVESLNVACAGTIVAAELMRRRLG